MREGFLPRQIDFARREEGRESERESGEEKCCLIVILGAHRPPAALTIPALFSHRPAIHLELSRDLLSSLNKAIRKEYFKNQSL